MGGPWGRTKENAKKKDQKNAATLRIRPFTMPSSLLDGFPFGDIEKEEFVKIVKQINSVFFSDIIDFCIFDNHFHLLVKMHPGHDFTDQEIKERFLKLYGDPTELMEDTGPLSITEKNARSVRIDQEIKEHYRHAPNPAMFLDREQTVRL